MKKNLWSYLLLLTIVLGLLFFSQSRITQYICVTINYCLHLDQEQIEKDTQRNKQITYEDIASYRTDFYNHERGYFPIFSWSTTYENPYLGGRGRLKLYGSLVDNQIKYKDESIAWVKDGYLYFDNLKILLPEKMQGWSYEDNNVDYQIWSWSIDQSLVVSNYFFPESHAWIREDERNIIIKKIANDFILSSSFEEVCSWHVWDIWFPDYNLELDTQSKDWREQYISYVIFDVETWSALPHLSNRLCFKLENVYYIILLQNIDRQESEKIFDSFSIES